MHRDVYVETAVGNTYFVGRLMILKHPVAVVFTEYLIVPIQPQHIAILLLSEV
jgi:hypothetical protein